VQKERAMSPIPPAALIPLLIVLPLVAFLVWMYRDMVRNDELPERDKESWTWMFLLLNVFGAGLYYINVYRFRRRR
jgi:hypothetical protein